ncbi:22958_t:CDS:2 [Cetraspora pellucida]|uniref:22958_t:CDS:1 n=1 Tax=Cetraspora pellucida TaxID=1433469 RepID=A0A9N9DX82_9GLOM|nr:22958_t:CDS:2 [Cetraspora pellucida]
MPCLNNSNTISQIVEKYNTSGHLLFIINYPNLLEHIHEYVEFGAAYKKRRKESIKVLIINYLQEDLRTRYNEYLSCSGLNNYLLPYHSNSIAAKAHHHLAGIAISSVCRNEKKEHPDVHYCFASVKGVKQFVARFFSHSVSFQELVTLSDHDFSIEKQQKLILSVYMLTNSSDINNISYNCQLAIFIRPQYQVRTNSASHIEDLKSLTKNNYLNKILKDNSLIKPIWVLLVDGGPDKNS